MDPYIIGTPKKIFTFKNITWVVMFLLLIYFIACNKKRVTVSNLTTADSIVARIIHDTVESKKIQDSLNKVIASKNKEISYWVNSYSVADNEVRSLEQEIKTRLNQTLPDTCKEYQQWVIKEFNRLNVVQARKDTAHKQIVAGKDFIISQKELLLVNSKLDYKKLRANTDTCLDNQRKLTAMIKPRNKISIGFVSNVYPEIGYGIGADFIHKSGWVISGSAMIMNGRTYGQIGIKKVIKL